MTISVLPKSKSWDVFKGGVKKPEGWSVLRMGVRPGLPVSATVSAGRWERESRRKRGALGPFLGPQPQAFCSVVSSLSVCGKLRLCGEPAYHHLHHRQAPAPTAALHLCLQCTYSPQGSCMSQVSWDIEWGTFPWGKASAMPLVMACPLSLQNDDYCTLGIEATYLSSSSREPLWILGDVFFKEFYCLWHGPQLGGLCPLHLEECEAAISTLPEDSAVALMHLGWGQRFKQSWFLQLTRTFLHETNKLKNLQTSLRFLPINNLVFKQQLLGDLLIDGREHACSMGVKDTVVSAGGSLVRGFHHS